MINEMLKRYPLISDQIDAHELRVILRELITVLENDTPGEVVEFGCYKGTTSLFLARILVQFHSDKKLFLYDSFAGLSDKSDRDASSLGIDFQMGELSATKNELLRNFTRASLPYPIIKKAWFKDLNSNEVPNEIAFAFFDGDFYESIRDSFRACSNKFSKRAIIIVDDYANEKLPGAAQATDEWLASHAKLVKRFHIEQSLGIIKLN